MKFASGWFHCTDETVDWRNERRVKLPKSLCIWGYCITFVRFEREHATVTPLYILRVTFWDLLARFVTCEGQTRIILSKKCVFLIVLSRAPCFRFVVIMPRFARITLSQALQVTWHHGIYLYILYDTFYVLELLHDLSYAWFWKAL
jgi:hypothetical protein